MRKLVVLMAILLVMTAIARAEDSSNVTAGKDVFCHQALAAKPLGRR